MTMPARTQQGDQGKIQAGKGGKPASAAADRQALIDGLNHDLAGEYQAILMYTHYSAKLTGPYRRYGRTTSPVTPSGCTRRLPEPVVSGRRRPDAPGVAGDVPPRGQPPGTSSLLSASSPVDRRRFGPWILPSS